MSLDRLQTIVSVTSTLRLPPDIQSQEVGPGEDIVSTNHHSDIRDEDVLQGQSLPHQRLFFVAIVAFSECEPTDLNAADDGGGEGRVVLRAQHDGVHQNKAAGQKETFFSPAGKRKLWVVERGGFTP